MSNVDRAYVTIITTLQDLSASDQNEVLNRVLVDLEDSDGKETSMKGQQVIETIHSLLIQLDDQSEYEEVLDYFSDFRSGGESTMSLEELKEASVLYDENLEEDGGHQW
jgi:hypothetical protein